LWLLCAMLIVWGPFELAVVTTNALASLAVRGPSLAAVIVLRLFVAAFGIAAGLTLATRRGPAAITMARVSLILTAAVDTLLYLTPLFPSSRPPGDEFLYVAVTLAYALVWLLYLSRSTRVRDAFELSDEAGTRPTEPLAANTRNHKT
jgi:hypothetical protein